MEINQNLITPQVDALALALAELATQDMICFGVPKLIAAAKANQEKYKVIHPAKHLFNVIMADLLEDVLVMAACPVATPPVV